MIKEYIYKLYQDNQLELDRLEDQMKSYMDELTYFQEYQENLQKEANSQTNIFSPRVFDSEAAKNLENVRSKIIKLNQQIEYVSGLIETHLKQKKEYVTLLDEVENNEKKRELKNSEINLDAIFEDESFEDSEEEQENSVEDSYENSEPQEKVEINNTGNNDNLIELAPVKTLLNEIYRKSEICLALVENSRCKKELKEIKKMIKEFAEKIK